MKKLLISLINVYQMFSSCFVFCKYKVSCSEFTKQAITKYGIFKGGILGLKRVLSCI